MILIHEHRLGHKKQPGKQDLFLIEPDSTLEPIINWL